jgi:hypothetical protein
VLLWPLSKGANPNQDNVFSIMHEDFRYVGYHRESFNLLLAAASAGLSVLRVTDDAYHGVNVMEAAIKSRSEDWIKDVQFALANPQRLDHLCRQTIVPIFN